MEENSKQPLVSVIIPSYNRADTIEKAVRSILSQTYTNTEIIIVDDGSKDNTADIVAAMKCNRIIYVHQENAGACIARNRGVRLAKGEYIAFQDSDDIWHPDKLEKQMEVMLSICPDVVVCKLVLHGNKGDRYTVPKRIGEGRVMLQDDIFGIGTQTILAKREVFENEPFSPEMPRLQELEWMIRVLKRYTVYCIDEGLVDYAINPDSISGNPEKLYRALSMILRKYPELKKTSPLLSMHAFKDLAENRNRAEKCGIDRRSYRRLEAGWFPGILYYFISYIRNVFASGIGNRQT